MTNISIATQGSYFKATVTDSPYYRETTPHRGTIKGFSNRSRKRLFEMFNRLEIKAFLFITLTYGQEFPDGNASKRDLKVFIQRLKRKYPQAAGVWRIEFQKRGAPHFHLLITNVGYIPKADILRAWEDTIAPQHRNQKGATFTRVELVRTRRKAISYVGKYVGKRAERVEKGNGFNTVPYQTAVGKHWGIIGKEYLPYAEETTVEIEVSRETYKRFKRVFRWSTRIDKLDNFQVGFTIFTERPEVWVELLMILAYE